MVAELVTRALANVQAAFAAVPPAVPPLSPTVALGACPAHVLETLEARFAAADAAADAAAADAADDDEGEEEGGVGGQRRQRGRW